jgi:hypothetical protein
LPARPPGDQRRDAGKRKAHEKRDRCRERSDPHEQDDLTGVA